MASAPNGQTQQKASDLEKGLDLRNEKWRDQRTRRRIQKRELRRILTFFMWANAVAGVAIFVAWLVEHFHSTAQPVITDKVVIAYLAGITVQSGAIILAAFKGLFAEQKIKHGSATNSLSTVAKPNAIAPHP